MFRLRSPRLTSRVAAFFGIIGLLAGLGLTTAAYSVARDSLVDQRVTTARSVAFDHALELRDAFARNTVAQTFNHLTLGQVALQYSLSPHSHRSFNTRHLRFLIRCATP